MNLSVHVRTILDSFIEVTALTDLIVDYYHHVDWTIDVTNRCITSYRSDGSIKKIYCDGDVTDIKNASIGDDFKFHIKNGGSFNIFSPNLQFLYPTI